MPSRTIFRSDIFADVKQKITVQAALEKYGVHVDARGLCCCPLHNEDTPSFKVYGTQSFYCFGCGTGGDVITLAAKLFSLSNREAAEKLAADFRILPPPEGSDGKREPVVSNSEKDEEMLYHIRLLSEYERMLRNWREDYAPVYPRVDNFHRYFMFACQELPWIEYMNDCMNSTDEHIRNWADQELSDLRLYERMEYMLTYYRREVTRNESDGKPAA